MPRVPFKENDIVKMLLWSSRCCCLCGKHCGDKIEIAHIDPKAKPNNAIDNGIPVCHDHHAEIGHYNIEHPLGNKYRIKELKMLREQEYDKHTKHLVPQLSYGITQVVNGNPYFSRSFPNVGFDIAISGDTPPVKAKVEVKTLYDGKSLGIMKDAKGYYSGEPVWNLTPNHIIHGNFTVQIKDATIKKDLKLEVRVTLIDQLEREHKFPIQCFAYIWETNTWFLEPRSFTSWK
jgi:hypothetical protein